MGSVPPLLFDAGSLFFFLLLQDTRTHVVVELYDNERSYVESLEILVTVMIIYIFSVEYFDA